MIIPPVIGVNPLQTTLLELGIVSGRVALLLRSAEIQPVFDRFVTDIRLSSSPPHPITSTNPAHFSIPSDLIIRPDIHLPLPKPTFPLTSHPILWCDSTTGVVAVPHWYHPPRAESTRTWLIRQVVTPMAESQVVSPRYKSYHQGTSLKSSRLGPCMTLHDPVGTQGSVPPRRRPVHEIFGSPHEVLNLL